MGLQRILLAPPKTGVERFEASQDMLLLANQHLELAPQEATLSSSDRSSDRLVSISFLMWWVPLILNFNCACS